MTESTDRLLEGLLGDLEPVRPLPRLRVAFASVLGLWTLLLGVVFLTQTGPPGARFLLRDGVYLASSLGLVVAALGGALSALAAGVPGREGLALGGMIGALLGLGSAGVACLVGIETQPVMTEPLVTGADGVCFRHGVLLSLLPAAVIFGFLVRGWPTHPIRAATIALLGSGALGVGIAQLSCSLIGPQHLLFGHLSVPVALSLIGLYPLAAILRRTRR